LAPVRESALLPVERSADHHTRAFGWLHRAQCNTGRRLLVVLISCVLSMASVAQMLPKIPGAKSPQTTENSAADQIPAEKTVDERIAALRARIPELKVRRQIFDDPGYVPPADISAREIENVRSYGDRLVMLSESALRSLEALQKVSAELSALEATAAGWQGFAEKPPYSILLVDDLSDQLTIQRAKLDSVQQRITASEQLIEEFRGARIEADQDARRLAEAGEAEKANRAAADWRWKAAVLRVEWIDAFITWALAELDRVKAEHAQIKAKSTLLERQLAIARSSMVFTKSDLAEARSRLSQQLTEVESAFTAAARESKQLEHARVGALQAVEDARRAVATGGSEATEALATAEDQLRVVNAQSDSARARGENLALQTGILRQMMDIWAERFTLVSAKSVLKRQQAAGRLKVMLNRATTMAANSGADVESFKAEEDESVERLALLDPDSAAAAREREVLNAIRIKLRVANRQQRTMEHLMQAVTRWLQEMDVDVRGDAVTERVRHRGAEAALLLRQLWRLELFSLDDTMKIGGEQVTVARPITVAKIATVGLWILIGLMLSRIATRYTHRALIEHYQVGTAQAVVLRRWITGINALILLLIGMYLVKIPLTAFAFLGGALAIGFGFGTQTLIKNLVSGVLMLVERQIRVNDVVEIAGVVGTVIAVDVRSTRVRNFDGKETLIPNSVFLESNVTNWTLTTGQIRLSIQVGVAYNSPIRLVAELLVKCAEQHGNVLKDPPPFVYLQAFGDNSLVFELYFWTEVGGTVAGPMIASDLRFMIDTAFSENGVVIAYPQRDLNFDPTRPIRVELAPSGSAPAIAHSAATDA